MNFLSHSCPLVASFFPKSHSLGPNSLSGSFLANILWKRGSLAIPRKQEWKGVRGTAIGEKRSKYRSHITKLVTSLQQTQLVAKLQKIPRVRLYRTTAAWNSPPGREGVSRFSSHMSFVFHQSIRSTESWPLWPSQKSQGSQRAPCILCAPRYILSRSKAVAQARPPS